MWYPCFRENISRITYLIRTFKFHAKRVDFLAILATVSLVHECFFLITKNLVTELIINFNEINYKNFFEFQQIYFSGTEVFETILTYL